MRETFSESESNGIRGESIENFLQIFWAALKKKDRRNTVSTKKEEEDMEAPTERIKGHNRNFLSVKFVY